MSAIEEQPLGIDVTTAIRTARATLISILEIEGLTYYNLRLEEVRHDDDSDEWLITYGLDVTVEDTPGALNTRGALADMLVGPRTTRVYRVIVLNGHTGRFKEMLMRDATTRR